MKYYGINSDGLLKIPSVSSLPTYNYTIHEGKVYYNETDDTFYIGHGNPTGDWYDIFGDSISASRTISFYQPTEDPGQSAVKYAYYDEDDLFLADWVLKAPHVASLPTYDHTLHKGLVYYLTTTNTVYVGVGTTGGGWRGITSNGLNWQTLSSNIIATPSNGYLVNATSGNITIVLPLSPIEGDIVGVCDTYNKATTNSITISCSGSKIEGATDDLILTVDGSSYTLVYIDSTLGWKTINSSGGGGGGGLTWQLVSTNTTAESQNGYLINATSGNITVTLPSSPIMGNLVGVCDTYNKATTNTITIARNGSNIEGVADDLILDVNGAGFTLVYVDATRGWEIVDGVDGETGHYFLFEQSTPATVWNVNHSIGRQYVNVEVTDSNDMVMIPSSIEFVDENNLTITLLTSKSGRASITTGGGGSSGTSGVDGSLIHELTDDLDTNEHDILIDDSYGILDENGNEQLTFNTVTNAVNELSITNAASGTGPILEATGDDTDIDINLTPKGAGVLSVVATTNYEDNVSEDDDIPNKKYIDPLAPQYQTISIPSGAMIPCTTNGAEASTEEYGTNDIDLDVLVFDAGATEERCQFTIPSMPENWDRGTVKVKFLWGNASGASAADTVEWGIKAGALGNDDVIDAVLGTPQVITDTVIADGDLHITSATPALTIGGTPALGDMIQFEIYRNTDGIDDMAEDAWLLGCVIQYKVDQTVSEWS